MFYNAFSYVIYPLSYPVLMGILKMGLSDRFLEERLALRHPKGMGGIYDFWLHAVSVGEIAVSEAIITSLLRKRKGLRILTTSSTPHGIVRLRSRLSDLCDTMVFPLDFPQVIRRFLSIVRPRVYGGIETELWPNLISQLSSMGTRCVLLNGRISERSFRFYKRLGFIFGPVLEAFSRICVINDTYRERLLRMGAKRASITVTGNAKYEHLLNTARRELKERFLKRLNLAPDVKIFCAGSIREGEERTIIDACLRLIKDVPDLIVFIVPRHVERAGHIKELLREGNISFQTWSDLEMGGRLASQWVLVDVIGPLYEIYGASTCAFVGGSLVDKGGQNLMEPASWSCPVIFGPYTSNFEEAETALMQYGGGIQVRDAASLVQALRRVFMDGDYRGQLGHNARRALEAMAQGAASRQADIMLQELDSLL